MFTIDRTAYLLMLACCQAIYPQEACGFLAGENGRLRVIYLIDNTLRSPVQFEMEAQQQFAAMLDMDESGLDSVVIFHSHPTGPSRPSATDRDLAYYPDWPQLIVSLETRDSPDVQLFRVSPAAVAELAWQIE
jgi:proteasome lid subunit RPN8/RPN11